MFLVAFGFDAVIQPTCLPVGGANANAQRRHRLLGGEAQARRLALLY